MKNTQVRTDLKVTPLLEDTGKRTLEHGRIVRIDEARCPKKYLSWRHQGKRSARRPGRDGFRAWRRTHSGEGAACGRLRGLICTEAMMTGGVSSPCHGKQNTR